MPSAFTDRLNFRGENELSALSRMVNNEDLRSMRIHEEFLLLLLPVSQNNTSLDLHGILSLWSDIISLSLDSQAKTLQMVLSPFVDCKINRV